jgi:tungstate transport system permease protein
LDELWRGFTQGVGLLVSLDPEVMEVAGRSLLISLSATAIASLVAVPLAAVIHLNSFPGKRAIITVTQALFSVPTVVVGLFVFVLFSSAGPLGGLNLIFTPTLMVIGQAVLITPLILGLAISALSGVDRAYVDTARSLGASGLQVAGVILREARFAVVAAVIMGFGRAVSEVGLAIMIGGNIKGFTRVITTAISLETSKGELELAIALGIILLIIALVINIGLSRVQQRA